MFKFNLRAVALLTLFIIVGCKRAAPPQLPPGVAPPDASTRLSSTTKINLAEWLEQPRPELVKLCEEWTETVQKQNEAIKANPLSVDLLPKLLPPLMVPIFQRATFDAQVGFSVPPYLEKRKNDPGVALHLAKHGDYEAAVKLAPAELKDRLAALKCDKNYPVEWTRLVGLLQISAQMKLSTGDPDGAALLVSIHEQLTQCLDEKAESGALGAALLPSGKTALEKAAVAWRDRKRNKIGLAEDVEKKVKEWRRTTAQPLLPFGADVAEVQWMFGTPAKGKAVFADTPERIARTFDLLGLPFPVDGAKVVAAFLDPQGKLAEWQLAYRAKIDTLYASPQQLAFQLSEAGFQAGKSGRTNNLYQQSFDSGEVNVEVTRCNRSPALGGFVRIVAAKNGLQPASLRGLRDFGPVHLDRGFESNRLTLSAAASGNPVIIKDSEMMQTMGKVLQTPTPDLVLLLREKDTDLVQVMEMAWPLSDNATALDKLLPSLWDDYGPAKIEDVEDQSGPYLGFTWQDKTTRVRLRLAYDERGPVLSARDLQPSDQLAARQKLAAEVDQKERVQRLSQNNGDERLSRSPGRVNDVSLAALKLGQSKSDAEKALPKGKFYRRKDLPDGINVTILTPPDKQMPYWARQLQVRFKDNVVSEIRLRYQHGPAKVKSGDPLLQALVDSSGAPESLPPIWGNLWSDLPNPGPITYYRWRDDRTIRTYQKDVGGTEVVWIDRPSQKLGLDTPSWKFVSDGVPRCQLGDTREQIESYYKTPATTSEGGEVYRTGESSPYEMLVVWYENNKATRILAIHHQRCGVTPKEVAAALSATWGKDVDNLGYIRRQQGQTGTLLGAYWWHDDLVRVRTTVQNTDQGPRIMTEWRYFAAPSDPTRPRG